MTRHSRKTKKHWTSPFGLRVLKTFRQTHTENISYSNAARQIIDKDGWMGLFGRGLKTRIITNGMQGLMFSVMWKYMDEKLRASK